VVAAIVENRVPEVVRVERVAVTPRRQRRVVPFPSPSPLTDEERALVMFAASGEKLQSFAEPIEITALRIEPLEEMR
jgi:hypothetical protein